jgi:hypothetical protein
MAVSLAPRGKRQRLTGIEALESNALIADAIQGESHLPAGLVMKNAAAFRDAPFPNYRSLADFRVVIRVGE